MNIQSVFTHIAHPSWLSPQTCPIRLVMGIESSCDETAISLFCADQGIVASALHSQVNLHQQYGGVVPELASRDHLMKLESLLQQCFQSSPYCLADIDAIAVTQGPGLAGALLTGASFASTLGWAMNVPVIKINHMEGHLLSVGLRNPLHFPLLGLLISGGHTQLIYATDWGKYEVIGQTLDDAIGEAFDKTAKLMGLPYPGGKELSELAKQGRTSQFTFTRPLTASNKGWLQFSFSGLKTHVRKAIQDSGSEHFADIALAFEECCADTLSLKVKRAINQFDCQQLVVAGGVACNQRIRHQLAQLCAGMKIPIAIPSASLCTDNADMIAYCGWIRANDQALNGALDQSSEFDILPKWQLGSVIPINA